MGGCAHRSALVNNASVALGPVRQIANLTVNVTGNSEMLHRRHAVAIVDRVCAAKHRELCETQAGSQRKWPMKADEFLNYGRQEKACRVGRIG